MNARGVTRRSLMLLSGSVAAWAAVRRVSGSVEIAREMNRVGGERSLLSEPLTVPRDFVGMHAHRWPAEAHASSAPTYAFGAARSHDHDGVFWNDLHVGRGHYAWDQMDRWVETHSAAGRTLIYTLYGTPAWVATEKSRVDLYGRAGGAAPPADLAPLAEFVGALLQRYNGDGKQRLSFVETWNEPHFEGESRDFWWGSAEELVGVGRTVYGAVKQSGGDVRVLSPGFVSDAQGASSAWADLIGAARHSSMVQYLTASDGQGKTGATWCDGVAFHTYNVALDGADIAGIKQIEGIAHVLKRLGMALPIYNTECGFVAPHPFRDLPPAKQALHLKRLGVLQAACGVQGLCFYSHDDEFVGNPSLHPEIAEAMDALHRDVAGATLQQVRVSSRGLVHVRTDAGEFVW